MSQQEPLRLQVFLSRQGVCSRRKAMLLIQEGRVKVNSKVVTEPSLFVNGTEKIEADGKPIIVRSHEYLLLNKPAGYVTTREDRFAEKTVLDLLPPELRYLHPVGRLDKETEGLLLLTSDGELTHQLTHPRHEIDKIYFVRAVGSLSGSEKAQLERGIILGAEKTASAQIADLRFDGKNSEFLMTIHEGRKRQIRLMLGQLGHKVIYLKRVQQGPLSLRDLKIGTWRRLTSEEVDRLKKL